MDRMDLVRHRQINQQMARPRYKAPGEVVAALGAVQAQDYPAALWSIGLRLRGGVTKSEVEGAIASRTIVRTWPMRGTLHFVAGADLRWMVGLTAARILATSGGRLRRFGLDEEVISRGRDAVVGALQGDRQLTRTAIYGVLEASGVSTAGQRGLQILWALAQRGVICFASHQGKQPAFALLEEWVPEAEPLGRDLALAELARRYFAGHGPATLRDFVWWSGLRVSDAASGLEWAAPTLAQETIDGVEHWMPRGVDEPVDGPPIAHLLPALDEYIIGYKDRDAMMDPTLVGRTPGGLPLLALPKIVVDGRVVGTWRRTFGKDVVTVELTRLVKTTPDQDDAISAAAERYGRFFGTRVAVR